MDLKEKDRVEIIEKPSDVSYDSLYELLFTAHSVNRGQGVKVNLDAENGGDLERQVGEEGKCYVAMADGKLAGTISISMNPGKKWYANKYDLAYALHLAVLPEFSGRGIGTRLMSHLDKYAKDRKVDGILLAVSADNPAQRIYKKLGYEEINYYRTKTRDHYAIHMIKWFSGHRVSKLYQKLYYGSRKLYSWIKSPIRRERA